MNYATRYIGGPIGRTFRRWGWAGCTLPIPFYGALVLMWDADLTNIIELRHEILGHIPQIERMGAFRYIVTILWQYATVGHEKSAMEAEARRLADAAHEKEERT